MAAALPDGNSKEVFGENTPPPLPRSPGAGGDWFQSPVERLMASGGYVRGTSRSRSPDKDHRAVFYALDDDDGDGDDDSSGDSLMGRRPNDGYFPKMEETRATAVTAVACIDLTDSPVPYEAGRRAVEALPPSAHLPPDRDVVVLLSSSPERPRRNGLHRELAVASASPPRRRLGSHPLPSMSPSSSPLPVPVFKPTASSVADPSRLATRAGIATTAVAATAAAATAAAATAATLDGMPPGRGTKRTASNRLKPRVDQPRLAEAVPELSRGSAPITDLTGLGDGDDSGGDGGDGHEALGAERAPKRARRSGSRGRDAAAERLPNPTIEECAPLLKIKMDVHFQSTELGNECAMELRERGFEVVICGNPSPRTIEFARMRAHALPGGGERKEDEALPDVVVRMDANQFVKDVVEPGPEVWIRCMQRAFDPRDTRPGGIRIVVIVQGLLQYYANMSNAGADVDRTGPDYEATRTAVATLVMNRVVVKEVKHSLGVRNHLFAYCEAIALGFAHKATPADKYRHIRRPRAYALLMPVVVDRSGPRGVICWIVF